MLLTTLEGRFESGRLAGKVALVTGASRGIGTAVGRGFAAEGAMVALNHPPAPQAREAATSVAYAIGEAGGKAIAVEADVTDPSAVKAMVEVVRGQLGPIEVLVVNAGLYPRQSWTSITAEEWDRVLAVNLDGAFYCCQAVYPAMRQIGRGSIITVSSVVVELGLGPFVHYVSSKAALIGMTRALSREVASDGIRVNCVMLGAIQTEQELEDFPDQQSMAAWLNERQSLHRRGTPEDTVGAFTYLASEESSFVTGQVIAVEGGWIHY